ncbi:MAG TPA: type II secretion system protein [Phycisphaerae bacterium]|nr:type II secretion system protein [Phycisphaerae bacterium]
MCTKQRAFTLIELMVVIGIIGLLLAILLPSLSAARTQAKISATKATLSVLDMGLEAFRADSSLGGAYPPSGALPARDPRQPPPADLPANAPTQGAELLVWGLAGADRLGTPGFPDNPPWRLNCNGGKDVAQPGLYSLQTNPNNMNDVRPFYPRKGPFIDINKVKILNRNDPVPVASEPPAPAMCVLDTFDRPILYYRATPGSPVMAADDYTYTNAGIYNLPDNSQFTGDTSISKPGLNLGGGVLHPFAALGIVGPNYSDVVAATNKGTFAYYIADSKITVKPTAQRPDSYLLISAGPDGKYGTADDVTNFKPNY